jgi:hypothetical protein
MHFFARSRTFFGSPPERARWRASDVVFVLFVRAESGRSAHGATKRARWRLIANLLFLLVFFELCGARQEIRKSFRFDQAMTCRVT